MLPLAGGQFVLMAADVRNEGAVAAAIVGADSVVNAVSAYVEERGVSYSAVHMHDASNEGARTKRRRAPLRSDASCRGR
jgi:hypothetical protein